MKKIMKDKSFWIILVCSVITLVGLTIGVIFLTRQNSKEFYSAGYIINSTATKSDKYYFEENTVYKENVFNEYVFKDVDNKEVSTSKDNFIHYLDNSLSFMKNGVIMDLDNFNENIVPYYNITDESIVKYNNGGYYIENADKTLYFGNFLGRITENKYIVVGTNISVKLSGNDSPVKGNYFEILFVEDGIVKIENQEGSYQTISDGTVVYIGDNIKIDLGNKSLNYGDETKLNLAELTIDGNENIDIVPEGVVDKDNNAGGGGGSGNGDGTGTGIGDGNGTGTGEGEGTGEGNGTGGGTGDGDGEGDGEGTGTGTGTGTGEGTGDGDGTGEGDGSGGGGGSGDGTGEGSGEGTGDGSGDDVDGETTTVLRKEVSVNLIEASSNVNTIRTKFQVIDTMEAIKGNLAVELFNVTTGEKVELEGSDAILANTFEEQTKEYTNLKSNCNYVMTITDGKGVQYFQKSFRTSSLDLSLKRELVTEDSLWYSLNFGAQSEVTRADVSLQDEEGNELYRHTIENGSDTTIKFEGLTNNTLYNVVVDNVVVKNVMEHSYSSRTSDLTLKNKPTLGEISVKTNDDVKNFTLIMDGVTDEDKTITKYTYEIYKASDLTEETMDTATPVYSFSRNDLDDQILKLDEKKNLYGNTDYRFKIVAQYYDNYRYNEIETGYSDYFQIVGKPTLSFEPTVIDINRIAGVVTFEDGNCTIPFNGRECYDMSNDFIIRYYGGSSTNRNVIENVKVDSKNMQLSFDLTGLEENTLYTFEVYANVDLHNGEGLKEAQYIGGFNATTMGINALMMQNWEKNGYSYETPISVNTEMVSTNPNDDSIDKLATITFDLYAGDVKSYIDLVEPIASVTYTGDIKDMFYNKQINITSNMFEYVDSETGESHRIGDLSVLKELSGGVLSRWYTIAVVDAYDSADMESNPNKFPILNNIYVYDTPAILLLEDQVAVPEIVVEEITNIQTQSGDYSETYGIDYISDLEENIVRGYKVTAIFEKNKIESYFPSGNPITKINFYAHNLEGKLIEQKTIEFTNIQEYTTYFFLGDGTDYSVKDEDMRRGNVYIFSYDIRINDDGDPNTDELVFPAKKPTSDPMISTKQAPLIKYYIHSSTDSSVTYKYKVYDYDKALYMEDGKYYIHYNNSGTNEQFTTEYVIDGSSDEFTLFNLSNGVVYSLGYYTAVVKNYKPTIINSNKNFYFDGYYDLNNLLEYSLVYSNDSNDLQIIIEDNELLNRVSSYLLTLEAEGVDNKYSKVISDLDTCGESKCIVVNYKDLNTTELPFKGKKINVSLIAFYDTGLVGFGQTSLLGDYFKKLGYVDEDNASKVGFVYQNIGNNEPGKYYSVRNGSFVESSGKVMLYDYPRGIFGFELVSNNNYKAIWKLNTTNLIDDKNNKFVSFGDIAYNNLSVISDGNLGSISVIGKEITVNPKVLDKTNVDDNDGSSFKFTSIIPEVKTQINRLINGAIIDIDIVNINEEVLKSDYVATDGKYKFYIDIYKEMICPELPPVEGEVEGEEGSGEGTEAVQLVGDCVPGEVYLEYVDTVETDYDSLGSVEFAGLEPATKYSYTISADMNKNGKAEKTLLFKANGNILETFRESFTTLNKNEIFGDVRYNYTSSSTPENYSNRLLKFNTYLKNKTNFDIKYQLVNDEGTVFDVIVSNEQITQGTNNIIASYEHDVTGNDFVFGPGYHELIITAITTDLGLELELYRDKLVYNGSYYGFRELSLPALSVINSANLNVDNLDGVSQYRHSISSTITVTDNDKVITDGIFNVELQDAAYNNACPGNEDACRVVVDINEGECQRFDNSIISACKILSKSGSTIKLNVVFDNLKEETNYTVYVAANTYRNNFNLAQKEKLERIRINQYTKSEYDFSLGAVTPTAKTKENLVMTFANSSNLTDSIVGIKYTVNVQNGDTVASGTFGKYLDENKNVVESPNKLVFGRDNDGYPTISIPITDGKLGLNNYIIVTYYYKDGDKVLILLDGDSTTYQYTVKNEF